MKILFNIISNSTIIHICSFNFNTPVISIIFFKRVLYCHIHKLYLIHDTLLDKFAISYYTIIQLTQYIMCFIKIYNPKMP